MSLTYKVTLLGLLENLHCVTFNVLKLAISYGGLCPRFIIRCFIWSFKQLSRIYVQVAGYMKRRLSASL